MADRKDSRLSTVSPLFNKMDAFLARHRAPAGPDIPVLTEEASARPAPAIPVLTQTVNHGGLMFNPLEFHGHPASGPSPVLAPKPPVPEPETIIPVFLDLPILDLDGLDDNPSGMHDPFDLEIDEPQQAAAPALSAPVVALPSIAVSPAPVAPVRKAEAPTLSTYQRVPATPVPPEAHIPVREEVIPHFPPAVFAAEPATIIPDEVLRSLEAPEIVLATDMPDVFTPSGEDIEEVIELVSMPDEADFPAEAAVVPVPLVLPEPESEPELSLAESADPRHEYLTLDHDDVPAPVIEQAQAALPVAPPKLSDAAIAEITASVGAHIAVEVSTEVAQLTRQHFASMMNSFYSDSLRKLTEEISRDLEERLAIRIETLVRIELKRQGLAD